MLGFLLSSDAPNSLCQPWWPALLQPEGYSVDEPVDATWGFILFFLTVMSSG